MSAHIISILLAVVCLHDAAVDSRLVLVPANSAAVAGNNVTFSCGTNNTNNSVEWLLVGLNNKTITFTVYNGSAVSPMFADRFSVLADQTTGRYDLFISNTSTDDAGTYTCLEQATRDNASAVYIVLAHEPYCSMNATADNILLGDVINMSCYVMFNGTKWQRPQMAWYLEDQLLKNDSYLFEPNIEVWSNITVTAELPTVRNHSCVTYFSELQISDDEPVNLSQSIPALNFTWRSTVGRVMFAPVNTTISGPIMNDTLNINDKLNCSTESFPAPSLFQWLDVPVNQTSTVDSTDGRVFTARKTGWRTITCVVYSSLRGITYNDTASVTVNVVDTHHDTGLTTTQIVGIAVAAFCLTFIVFVGIFCIVRRRRLRHPYRQMDEDAEADVGRSSRSVIT